MRNERDPFKGTNGSLQDLVDKIKDVLKCPVTIEDHNHRLLAYSTHDDQTDSARIATIIKRRVPEKVINRLWKDGIIQKLMQSEEPVYIPEIKDIGLGDRIAISIKNSNEILGYMWLVQETGKLTDDQLIIFRKAVKTVKTEMLKRQTVNKRKDEDYQNFFWQLLTGHFLSHDDIVENYQKLNLVPPAQFAVLVFRFKEEVPAKLEQGITYLLTTSQQVSIPFYMIMGNELILIAASPRATLTEAMVTEFIETFITQMKNRLVADDISGSCGTIYRRLDKISKSYQEALAVHRLKQQYQEEINGVVHFHQLGIFRYLDLIIEKKQLEPYMHPVIEKLEQYDKVNKTNLLETLEIYISHDSNINDAAKKLHVHSNTLNYRMKRIIEITDLDLKSANEKMSLFIEMLLRRIEKNKRL